MKTKLESPKRKGLVLCLLGLFAASALLLGVVISAYPAMKNKTGTSPSPTESPPLIDEWRRKEYVSPVPKDRYDWMPDFALLLNSDIRRRDAQVELGLTDRQVEFLSSVRDEDVINQKPNGPKTSTWTGNFNDWLKDIDRRIKYSMSPLQYVRFRDWMAEQWNTDTEHWHIVHKEQVFPVPPENRHLLKFLKERVGLNDLELQKINDFLNREKSEKILPVRMELYNVSGDPAITWEETNKIGLELITKIEIYSQSFNQNFLTLIPKSKQGLYQLYQQIPEIPQSFFYESKF